MSRGHPGANEQKCQTIRETGLKVLFLAQGLKKKKKTTTPKPLNDCLYQKGRDQLVWEKKGINL